MSNLARRKKICPFLDTPMDDCYCTKMSSQDIEKAVYLCTVGFKACELYVNNKDAGRKRTQVIMSH